METERQADKERSGIERERFPLSLGQKGAINRIRKVIEALERERRNREVQWDIKKAPLIKLCLGGIEELNLPPGLPSGVIAGLNRDTVFFHLERETIFSLILFA